MTEQAESIAVVFAGGEPVDARWHAHVPATALVIAADSGLVHAQALGRSVDLVVGDLDSVPGKALDRAVAAGAQVERHPVDKDKTDLELAIDAAVARGSRRVLVLGAGGGERLDHFLANMQLLASPSFADVEIDAFVGLGRIAVVRQATELRGHPGELVSLLALGGPAHGVRTEGLRYPLNGESLYPGSTRGVSNELEASRAHVSIDGGVLLAVQPQGDLR